MTERRYSTLGLLAKAAVVALFTTGFYGISYREGWKDREALERTRRAHPQKTAPKEPKRTQYSPLEEIEAEIDEDFEVFKMRMKKRHPPEYLLERLATDEDWRRFMVEEYLKSVPK